MPADTNYNKGSDTSHRGYRDPAGGTDSDIGVQFRTDYYQKKALIEAKKEQYFSQMADVTSMPKNFGKTIKRYHYMPLLHDGNINDQGIDAAGVIADGTVGIYKATAVAYPPLGDGVSSKDRNSGIFQPEYFMAEDVVAATAITAAELVMDTYLFETHGFGTGAGDSRAAAIAAGWGFDSGRAVPNTGNLYGSSKDVGTIAGKLPTLSEHGGRVNRVGFKRIELQGSIEKFGFFDEYTQESMDFDTDGELMMHINREMVMGANEITEDALQIDLLNGAGVVRFAGDATMRSEIQGEVAAGQVVPDVITYEDLMKLSIDLDNNRTPKNTKIITGSRMIDTRVIDSARFIYIGSELIPTFKRMVDLHGNPAYISVQHYAGAGNPTTTNVGTGEIGSVDNYRIIVVPEMMNWSGAGAPVTDNAGYRETNGNFDVYPALVIGSESFTTIGFQTDGKTVKFKITHKKPGSDIANRDDPYGEVGFMSIKWYYGIMILRPERLALVMAVAEL